MDRDDLSKFGGVIIVILILLLLGAAVLSQPGDGTDGDGGIPTGGTPCTSDADCPPGEICIEGLCGVPEDECTSDFDCPSGICIDGVCEDECASDFDCPPGEECVDGACVDDGSCTSDFDCPDGVCIGGVCTSGCSGDFDCPPGEICVDGSCEEEDGGDDDTIYCPDGECPDGMECVDGVCVDEGPECEGDEDCPGGICVGGVCVGTPPECTDDEDCPAGECIGGVCTSTGSMAGDETFCEGCPSEDSLATKMFLNPDIPDKQVSMVVFAEEGTSRLVLEDATVFAQVIANDLSSIETCKMLTNELGQATFDYSEKQVCAEKGCIINLVFCCANIGDACLLPVCLGDESITSHYDIDPCEPASGAWPTQARVVGAVDEMSPLYPAMDDISIPPEPKLLGLGFTLELCFPVLAIFGLLSAAMFASGRNPFQMFSLHTPRFKRAAQRAIRARGFTINFSAIGSSIASAAQGHGGKKSNRPRGLKARMKGAGKALKNIGKVRQAVKRARAGKGFTGAQVQKAKGAGGAGAGGPEGGEGGRGIAESAERGGVTGDQMLAAEEAGYTLQWMAKSGVGTSAGMTAKAGFAAIGSAFLTKLLGRYAFTSWIVYGSSREGGFKGLRRTIDEALAASAAPRVVANCSTALNSIGWTEAASEDGKSITASYTNEKGERITRTFDNDEAGQSALIKLRGEILMPTLIIMNHAAALAKSVLAGPGSDMAHAMDETLKAGAEEMEVEVSGGKKKETAKADLDDMRAQGKKKYSDKYEPYATALLPTEAEAQADATVLEKNAKLVKYVDSFEKQASRLGTPSAAKKNEVMNKVALGRAAAVLEKAEAQYGAKFVANDPTLSRLAVSLGNASEASASNAKPGAQANSMIEFRNYSRALTGSIAVEGGNTHLLAAQSRALADSVGQAGQAGAAPSRTDLMVAAAILNKAEAKMGARDTLGNTDLASMSSSVLEGAKLYGQNAPEGQKAEALNTQIYLASSVASVAMNASADFGAGETVNAGIAQGRIARMRDEAISMIAGAYKAADDYLAKNAPADIRMADESQKALANTMARFEGAGDPTQYMSASEVYSATDSKILNQARALAKYGLDDDGSKNYEIQNKGYLSQAASEVYAEEKKDYISKVMAENYEEGYKLEDLSAAERASVDAQASNMLVRDLATGEFKPSESTAALEKQQRGETFVERFKNWEPGKQDEERFNKVQARAAQMLDNDIYTNPGQYLDTIGSAGSTPEQRAEAVGKLADYTQQLYKDSQVPEAGAGGLPKPSELEQQVIQSQLMQGQAPNPATVDLGVTMQYMGISSSLASAENPTPKMADAQAAADYMAKNYGDISSQARNEAENVRLQLGDMSPGDPQHAREQVSGRISELEGKAYRFMGSSSGFNATDDPLLISAGYGVSKSEIKREDTIGAEKYADLNPGTYESHKERVEDYTHAQMRKSYDERMAKEGEAGDAGRGDRVRRLGELARGLGGKKNE
ncbi:hypothetical protein JW721_01155 [Candidatus Micrarchaeota archaeon]|nr:hypothetical protein [Candidatus Micrarchaeota archaeon]